MGPESVVLSLGSRGAVGAFAEGMLEAVPPRVDAVCPIGAGDALAAAFTWAMIAQGQTRPRRCAGAWRPAPLRRGCRE